MNTGIELIAQERDEQLTVHKRTIGEDVEYNYQGNLAIAARTLLKFIIDEPIKISECEPPKNWEGALWRKMVSKPYKDRLIIAGALIAAELDRLTFIETYNSKSKKTIPKNDPVNHPAHYTSGSIEVIDAIEDWKLDFHLGQVVKYVARAGKKDPAKEKEDLMKAEWYLKRKTDKL